MTARSHPERCGGVVAPRRVVAPRTATTLMICDAVAAHYGITRADILGSSQEFRFSRPRQAAMYLACRVAQRSLSQVGRVMGRHHVTVLHASRVTNARLHHPKLMQDLTAIVADIGRRAAV